MTGHHKFQSSPPRSETYKDNENESSINTKYSLDEYIRNLPKIELHAHLSGCVRDSTIVELCNQFQISTPEHIDHYYRPLEECFPIFGCIHSILRTRDVLRRITFEALCDFSASYVCYLELRTTPRSLQDGLTKRGYIETVLNVMHEFEQKEMERYKEEGGTLQRLPLIPRLIISIDRAKSTEEAWENIHTAMDLIQNDKIAKRTIVGVDLGGNPHCGNFAQDFRPIFEYARSTAKLHVTIHTAEVTDDEEVQSILSFHPDRIGHALFLPAYLYKQLQSKPIPIECCPTSNVKTLELATHHREDSLITGLQKHPNLHTWIEERYPISICTDDPGVFRTDSSCEYRLLQKAFPHLVSQEYLHDVILSNLGQIFDGETKLLLKQRVRSKLEELEKFAFSDS